MGRPAVDEWEAEKSQNRNEQTHGQSTENAHGTALNRSRRRTKPTRTLPDSSSSESSQQEVLVSATDSPLVATSQDPNANPEEQPSSFEIPETQQDPPPPLGIFVDVPRRKIDFDDYESLHSSQVESSGSLAKNETSPLQSPTKSINQSSQHHLDSSPSKTGHTICSVPSSQLGNQPDVRIRGRVTKIYLPVTSITQNSLRQSSTQPGKSLGAVGQPLTRDIPSSSLSSQIVSGPEYVPSTIHNSRQTQQEQTVNLEASPGNSNSSQPSTWEFQTKVQPSFTASNAAPVAGRTNETELPAPTRASSTRSASYQSAEQCSTRSSPLFCSPGSQRAPSFSPVSAFDDDFPIDSIESDLLPSQDIMDTDLSIGMSDPPEPGITAEVAPQVSTYDHTLGGSALPIQDSIEEEEPSSTCGPSSSDSKQSSSQQSIDNETDVAQIAGLVEPSLPILGTAEYVLTLPCEGKIQSTYADIIKAKEKSIKKFLSRHESIGSANGSPNRTHERNEMNEMIQLLHDTVTHMDLGLRGLASTQYSINSQEHAAYANYAGAKFSFLGYLVDMLKQVGVSIIVMSCEGQIQDLLEQYLKMKHIATKRQDRIARSKSPAPDRLNTDFQVELIGTWTTHAVDIRSRPCLMLAFDASFDAADPQVARIRAKFGPGKLMPVVHLIVANSSEHVDRCLMKSLPSPIRLKALVRYTYRALPHLGGKLKWIRKESDIPDNRPMDLSDVQKGVRKSPERKLQLSADMIGRAAVSPDFALSWTLGVPAALELTEMDETPSLRPSRAVTRPETPRDFLVGPGTPASRAGTPSGRKRLLDVDGILPALTKRQRLTPTPLRDSVEANLSEPQPTAQHTHLHELVKKLQADLAVEKEARQAAEKERDHVKDQLEEWRRDHASLQRRYEVRMTKCHALDKEKAKLLKTVENNKTTHERSVESNSVLRQKNTELQKELALTREELKAGGGDGAVLEVAREQARILTAKNASLEKSLENTRRDFEFTRSQYQNASNQAAELASQNTDLEKENVTLSKQASDEKRRLRAINSEEATSRHLAKITELELERKSRDLLIKKIEEENRQLKRNRGVQTRGSSVQPPGSPNIDGPATRGTRSRQGSPAPGLFAAAHRGAERGSLLRNER